MKIEHRIFTRARHEHIKTRQNCRITVSATLFNCHTTALPRQTFSSNQHFSSLQNHTLFLTSSFLYTRIFVVVAAQSYIERVSDYSMCDRKSYFSSDGKENK